MYSNRFLLKISSYFLFIIFIFISIEVSASNRVTSVNAYQEGKNIVITYQLSEKSYISVSVSTDSGHSFKTLKSVTGDVGNDILPGNRKIVWNVVDEYEKFNFSEVCFRVVSFNAESVKNNGHEYVDLGLPSGTLWATCNVGATKPEEYGDYFAWGETKSKYKYNRSNYKWCKVIDSYFEEYTKYCIYCLKGRKDYKSILELSDDVAYVNWGGDWRIPTRENLEELHSECTWTWVTKNNINGYTVTGPSGNSIFLPAAGYYEDSYYIRHQNSLGCYWSSSHNMAFEDNVDGISFSSNYVSDDIRYCFEGCSIRPVLRVGFTYGITFDSNGGEGNMLPISVEHSEVLSIPENTFTRSGYEFIGWGTKADGTGTRYEDEGKISVGDNVTLYAQWYKKETDIIHEYVDLGLPSGTLWATMNIGANSSEDIGYFFAWGETKPKACYDKKTYKLDISSYSCQTNVVDKNNVNALDRKNILKLSDDAAHVNWGGDWRMPSKEECEELISECIWTWTTQNGVAGYEVKSKINSKSIFLPAWPGAYKQHHINNQYTGGYIWTSERIINRIDNSYMMTFSRENFLSYGKLYITDGVDQSGYNVRPVMSRKSRKSYRPK